MDPTIKAFFRQVQTKSIYDQQPVYWRTLWRKPFRQRKKTPWRWNVPQKKQWANNWVSKSKQILYKTAILRQHSLFLSLIYPTWIFQALSCLQPCLGCITRMMGFCRRKNINDLRNQEKMFIELLFLWELLKNRKVTKKMMHSVYWASPWAGEQRKGLDPKPDVYSFLPQNKGAGPWAYRGWAVSRGFLGKLYLFSLQETGEVSNKPRLGIFSIFPSICPVLKSEILPCFLFCFVFFPLLLCTYKF